MMISKTWFSKNKLLIIFSGFLLILQISGSLQFLEERFYVGMMSFSNKKASEAIEIISIDDESVKRLGGWSLSRSVYARVLEQLKDAKLIVLTLFLDKMQHIEFNKYIRDILQFSSTLSEQLRQLSQSIQTDQQLAEAIRNSGKVILNMPLWLNNQPDTNSFLLALSQLPAGALNDWNFNIFPPAASVALRFWNI